jgi:predicted Zn-dependent peptidase
VGSILNMELYQLGLDHLLQLPGRIRSLTPDDLLAAAQHYLDPEKLVIGVAGPPA